MTMANWIFILLGVLFMVALLSRYMMVQDRRRHSRRRGGSGESDAEQIEYDRRLGIERRCVMPIGSQHAVVRSENGIASQGSR